MAGAILPVNTSIPQIAGLAPPSAAARAAPAASAFQDVFAEAVGQVEQFQANASASIGRFVAGEGEELHQVALATQQANLAFNLFMQVRNKVISAYQEVMRLQV